MGISNIVFLVILITAITWFSLNAKRVIRNISLGMDLDRSDRTAERWKTMGRVALGQSKMLTRPIPAVLHIFVYVGFVLINVEVIEMLIDGAFGTHRVLSFMGNFYKFLLSFFEILAFLVFFGCAVFLIRRNVLKIKRFMNKELNGWPRSDANIILITEILLMAALFLMNASEQVLKDHALGESMNAFPGGLPVSKYLAVMLSGLTDGKLILIERFCWWFHMIGILGFLNYLPYSKHFHILLAFPNTWFSNLESKGKFTNLSSVTNEVKVMLDPSYTPLPVTPGTTIRFGAKDVFDLSWKQLLDAYSCTECGRCTSSCPANQTGKKLSPRKIMMDTRDRLEEVGRNIDSNEGQYKEDGRSLLNYISEEELWACTTCNACVQECPVNIDPLSIIIDMRRFLVMEQSAAPQGLNLMFTNIENNGAPWQFSPADRGNWEI
jgi:ferredoxin